MEKRIARKRKANSSTAANAQSAVQPGRVATLARSDLIILVALGAITFGIYAQVIGHQFITLDDPTYIQENPMVNRGVTGAGLAWAFTTFHGPTGIRSRGFHI